MAFSLNARFKTNARGRRRSETKNRGSLPGIVLMTASVLAMYCVLFPLGLGGKPIKAALATAFGVGRFIVPLWAGYVGLRFSLRRPWPQPTLRIVLGALFQAAALSFVSLFSQLAFQQNAAGVVGLAGQEFLVRLFGPPGAWLVSLTAMGLAAAGLMRVSPMTVVEWLWTQLKNDVNEWRSARQQTAAKKDPVVKPRPMAPAPLEPRPAPTVVKNTPTPVVAAPPPAAPTPARESAKPVAPRHAPAPAVAVAGPAAAARPPYQLPPISLLSEPDNKGRQPAEDALVAKAKILEQTLANFGVEARTTDIHPGPVITRYDLEPAPGVKISSIVNLADDIALAMKATRVRVLAPIPGKGAVGVEIPNSESVIVSLKEIIADARFQNSVSPLTVALGKTSSGEPHVTDLAPMPHLLVAGATGAGKSVAIHTLIMSVLLRAKPDQVKFCLIDPKRLELPVYDGLPHLYDPRTGPDAAQVITLPKEAAKALQRMVKVMEYRYEIFARANVRNIEGYNEKRRAQGLPPEFYIIVVIDELADLMLISAKEVEDCIQRLAQMARAVGIHLVLATQRPSVDVITGVIKANLPARIALRVASQIDSRVILDGPGAESLVGKGDMLFLPAGAPQPIRLQGAFVSEKEVEAVVNFCKSQGGPDYVDIFAQIAAAESAQEDSETRQQLDEALRLVVERKRVSQDLLKAHFGSSARATNVLSLLEVKGFIFKPEGTNKWEIYFDKIDDYFRIPGAPPPPPEEPTTPTQSERASA
ncbi:MAG: DNA translocase FtsK 4TM domain-containing protein [Elusimicrobia bacterium]|nr:DNA translocase FtsK 4TM domain-containing protein [Elusimicrobiota bacterium]